MKYFSINPVSLTLILSYSLFITVLNAQNSESYPILKADSVGIAKTLSVGNTTTQNFEIRNTGNAALEYSITKSNWFWFEESPDSSSFVGMQYDYKTVNTGDPIYKWMDITETGIREPMNMESPNIEKYWHTLTDFPFPIRFYGKEYTTLRVSENGIISFGEETPGFKRNPEPLPTTDRRAYLMPFWSSGNFSSGYPRNKAGLFYEFMNDRVIISWEAVINQSGPEKPISFQVVFFQDGSFKFQYKPADITGEENVSNSAQIAIQKPNSTEVIKISVNEYLNHGKGLAYLFLPGEIRSLKPGGKVVGKISFSSVYMYGGVYWDTLKIYSNDPAKPIFRKPLKFTVNGKAAFEVPVAVDFGQKEISMNKDSSYVFYEFPLELKNEGDAPLTFKKARMLSGEKGLTQLIMFKDSVKGWNWTPIEQVFDPQGTSLPEYTIFPGEKMQTKVRFTPSVAGNIRDELILTTHLGDKRVILRGVAYNPPRINIRSSSVKVAIDQPVMTQERLIEVDNKWGEWVLNYEVGIEYKRSTDLKNTGTWFSGSTTEGAFSDLPCLDTDILSGSEDIPFNAICRHVKESELSASYGLGGGKKTIVATKFQAGPSGVNISDVGTWFLGEKSKEDTISVEVRAGGSSINNAVSLATGRLIYAVEEEEKGGSMQNIPLDQEATVYPNEDFYVIISYPSSVEQPQGCAKHSGVATVSGRYLVNNGGIWKDIQQTEGFSHCAWIMYAGEKAPKDNCWVKVAENRLDTIQVGDSSFVRLLFDATIAPDEDCVADLLFKSNDSRRPLIKIPVSMHINQPPYFQNAPEEIELLENTRQVIEIGLEDAEDDDFVVESVIGCKFVTYDITKYKMTLTVFPGTGDKGIYTVKYRATDQHNAQRELEISIRVTTLPIIIPNKPPVFIGDSSHFVYSFRDKNTEYNIYDWFEDPEGETLQFEVSCQHPDIIEVVKSGDSTFIVSPRKVGQTKLNIKVADLEGDEINYSIDVEVGLCINPSGIIVQKWNNILLVDNYEGKYNPEGYQWYLNHEPLPDAVGQYYSAGDKKTDLLDFTGSYYVRLVTAEGETFYTCPMTPVDEANELKAYPNPVSPGNELTIQRAAGIGTFPVTIQVFHLSGQLIETHTVKDEHFLSVKMPSVRGVYLVKVRSGNSEKTITIKVE